MGAQVGLLLAGPFLSEALFVHFKSRNNDHTYPWVG